MKKLAFLFLISFLLGCFIGCSRQVPHPIAKVVRVEGQPQYLDGSSVKDGDELQVGDLLSTGDGELIIAEFLDGSGAIEVQQNAELVVNQFDANSKKLSLGKGSAWLKVSKLRKDASFSLATPNSTAAVRGTQFYSFEVDGMRGICYCEGEVDYSDKNSDFKEVHAQDYVILSKDGKTALLAPEDLSFLSVRHDHSQVSDSVLGAQSVAWTEEEGRKFNELVTRKLKVQ